MADERWMWSDATDMDHYADLNMIEEEIQSIKQA